MDILGLVFRWLHIVPALVMVGGIFFLRFCMLEPGSTDSSLFDRNEAARKRWMKWVMLSTLLLLVSGLYNTAMKAMGYELDMIYNGLLLVKILLALVVFYLSAVMTGRSEKAKRLRQQEKYWLNVSLFLMIVIVLIGGLMKLNSAEAVKKVRPAEAASQRQAIFDPTSEVQFDKSWDRVCL